MIFDIPALAVAADLGWVFGLDVQNLCTYFSTYFHFFIHLIWGQTISDISLNT